MALSDLLYPHHVVCTWDDGSRDVVRFRSESKALAFLASAQPQVGLTCAYSPGSKILLNVHYQCVVPVIEGELVPAPSAGAFRD